MQWKKIWDPHHSYADPDPAFPLQRIRILLFTSRRSGSGSSISFNVDGDQYLTLSDADQQPIQEYILPEYEDFLDIEWDNLYN